MSIFWSVITSLFYTAAFIACLWWANWAFQQLHIGQRIAMPALVRLLIVLAVGGLVYSPVARILSDLFDIFRKTSNGWINAAGIVGALATLAFVAWLYMRAVLDR